MSEIIQLPELEIYAEDNKFNWRKIGKEGCPFPTTMRKTSNSHQKQGPEITFGFEFAADYPLMYFRSPLARDVAFHRIQNSPEYSNIRLGRNDFFKTVIDKHRKGMVSTMKELEFKDIFSSHIMNGFNNLRGLNESPFMTKPLTNELYQSIMQDKFDVAGAKGMSKEDLVIQLCNTMEKPIFPGSDKIPPDLFWRYFISNLQSINYEKV